MKVRTLCCVGWLKSDSFWPARNNKVSSILFGDLCCGVDRFQLAQHLVYPISGATADNREMTGSLALIDVKCGGVEANVSGCVYEGNRRGL